MCPLCSAPRLSSINRLPLPKNPQHPFLKNPQHPLRLLPLPLPLLIPLPQLRLNDSSEYYGNLSARSNTPRRSPPRGILFPPVLRISGKCHLPLKRRCPFQVDSIDRPFIRTLRLFNSLRSVSEDFRHPSSFLTPKIHFLERFLQIYLHISTFLCNFAAQNVLIIN